MEQFSVVMESLTFAAHKHRDQRRKSTAAHPYINHPIEVAELLWTVAGVRDPDVISAAILHDTIEDTDTTEDEVRERFGEKIFSIVLEVTDDKSLPKQDRKRLQVEHAPHKTPEASHVKLADKTCNIRDMAKSPPKDWPVERRREYVEWARNVVNGLPTQSEELRALFDQCCEKVLKNLES